MRRDAMLAAMNATPDWDVVVVGGGATGLGAALDAVSRGYRTVLLEAVDFAKGTSSRSTKLIHGGVRYLRSGQIRMVRESLLERGRLLRNAPHIVHSRKFVIPTFRAGARWYYFAGLTLYDLLAGNLGVERSKVLNRRQTSQLLPTLQTQRLCGGVQYCDGQFDDARLAIALAQTIVDRGGLVLNYAEVTQLLATEGALSDLVFCDHVSGEEHRLATKVIINATGVFGANVMQLDPSQDLNAAPSISPSQGAHLVLSRDFLPSESALMIPDTDDGRVLFAIPWCGRTLVGTTDNPVSKIQLDPRPTQAEIDYLLDHAGRYLTKVPKRSDVLAMFAGLRPLVGKPSGGKTTASLSREHAILTSPSGLITVLGGKWTTYRRMGEEVVNLAAKVGKLTDRPSATSELRLHGYPTTRVANSQEAGEPMVEKQTPSLAHTVQLQSYGADADAMLELIHKDPTLGEPLHPGLPYLKVQVQWAIEQEMARSIEDVLSRRLRALLLDARAAMESAPYVAEKLREYLGQDPVWFQRELDRFSSLAMDYCLGENEQPQ